MSDTAKNWVLDKAPKRIKLLGDKARPESAQHIIEFPGGAVEISRTSDGDYWAHIIVNHGFGDGDTDGISGAQGHVVDARIDRAHPLGVQTPKDLKAIQQIAVLIRKGK